LGAGVIYYPISPIQVGLTLGYSLSLNDYQIPTKGGSSYNSDFGYGFGWNISAATDLGKNNHGCLIGLKYSGAFNWLVEPVNKTMLSTDLGIFIKYAYRKKVPKQTLTNSVFNKRNASGQSRSNSGIDEAISGASKNLINKLPEKSRVAVISISSNNREISAYIVDEIEYQLVNSGKFTIVDRKTLDIIRSEQNFQMSGEVSDNSAVSIGQMLGANIVITGNIIGTGTNQRLSIRALDVSTAEIVTIVREDF
jgi:TolB-like protein